MSAQQDADVLPDSDTADVFRSDLLSFYLEENSKEGKGECARHPE